MKALSFALTAALALTLAGTASAQATRSTPDQAVAGSLLRCLSPSRDE